MMGAFFGMGYFCPDDVLLSSVRILSEVRMGHLGRKWKNYNGAVTAQQSFSFSKIFRQCKVLKRIPLPAPTDTCTYAEMKTRT